MGRVFSGKRAYNMIDKNSLVDIIGGYYDAIDVAIEMAQIPQENDIKIVEYPKKSIINNYFDENVYLNTMDDLLYPYLKDFDYISLLKVLNNSNMQLIMPYKVSLN